MAGKYPKPEYVAHATTTVLQHKRASDKVIEHPREQPGNIIIIHGVNDVGTSYADVEAGLCAGLERRLYRHFKPADYTLPTDKDKVVDDPDAAYYKRKVGKDTNSPVIPFYWGFREIGKYTKTVNGQKTDRYGNRLDKDLSKEGGPFGNATSTLPDMWNCGVGAPVDIMNDPLRPLRSGPGRMYMVLAARRLAALVAMIRDYEPKDTVTIVAHSQGCLIGLLAQAFLMERGERTADTLILTHPPYGLDEDMNSIAKVINAFSGGQDSVMAPYYDRLSGTQTMNARLQTLVNIVQGVAKAKADQPAFAKIDEASCGGMVEGRWKPAGDRDNRGKVYLYFSPEDMTVALDNMKGIGWQGVPDYIRGTGGRGRTMVPGGGLKRSCVGLSPSWERDSVSACSRRSSAWIRARKRSAPCSSACRLMTSHCVSKARTITRTSNRVDVTTVRRCRSQDGRSDPATRQKSSAMASVPSTASRSLTPVRPICGAVRSTPTKFRPAPPTRC
jgi:pimeloyl-ACP methyl ester carboxylesterase